MRLLIASDSYKGSLDTLQVAESMKEGIRRVFPEAEIEFVPIADGGEGTVEALVTSLGGKYCLKNVTGPNGKEVEARYGILENDIAVIEMAAASGLPLVPSDERDIMRATSYGTGQLIQAALDQGCTKIYLGIGGSATNDGGVGIAQALGIRFLNSAGDEVEPGGGFLKDIREIDVSGLDERIRRTEIFVMCDVTNPLVGPNGASHIYGPQKGATREQIQLLDENLLYLSDLIKESFHKELTWTPGAGAAGGAGMGLMAFLDAKILPGVGAVMDAANMDEKLAWADLVITGEGKIDHQSVCGKVIDGLAERAKRYHKPVIAIAGSIGSDVSKVYHKGVDSLEAAVCRPMKLEQAMENAAQYVTEAAERAMRTVRVGMEMSEAGVSSHPVTSAGEETAEAAV